MSLELLATIKASQELLESPWQEVGLRELGSRKVDLPTRSNWLLQADAKLAWLRWWIEEAPFQLDFRTMMNLDARQTSLSRPYIA